MRKIIFIFLFLPVSLLSQIDTTALFLNYDVSIFFDAYSALENQFPESLNQMVDYIDNNNEVKRFFNMMQDPIHKKDTLKYLAIKDSITDKIIQYYLISNAQNCKTHISGNDTLLYDTSFLSNGSFANLNNYQFDISKNFIIYENNIIRYIRDSYAHDTINKLNLLNPKYKLPFRAVIKIPATANIKINKLNFEIKYPITIKGTFYSYEEAQKFLKQKEISALKIIQLKGMASIDFKENTYYLNNCFVINSLGTD